MRIVNELSAHGSRLRLEAIVLKATVNSGKLMIRNCKRIRLMEKEPTGDRNLGEKMNKLLICLLCCTIALSMAACDNTDASLSEPAL